MQIIESHKCASGMLHICEHKSEALKCTMRFSLFLPKEAETDNVPLLTFLSGLTCTHENFTTKAGAYIFAAQAKVAILAPDTSPRGDDVPDDAESYDFGKGAGFYINATQMPWAKNYQMESYIVEELNALVLKEFPIKADAQGIFGHSMGGHGALTLGLKYPEKYKSISAFSPIVAPSQVPWGEKAFTRYLGDDLQKWQTHDACALMKNSRNRIDYPEILIDQGLGDQFLEEQLKPDLFKEACANVGQTLKLRKHEGYDHSYYFISSFIGDHIAHHASILG